jgi:hypothetical protein
MIPPEAAVFLVCPAWTLKAKRKPADTTLSIVTAGFLM